MDARTAGPAAEPSTRRLLYASVANRPGRAHACHQLHARHAARQRPAAIANLFRAIPALAVSTAEQKGHGPGRTAAPRGPGRRPGGARCSACPGTARLLHEALAQIEGDAPDAGAQVTTAAPAQDLPLSAFRRLVRVREWMASPASDGCAIVAIALHAGMSVSYLHRHFSRVAQGQSVAAFFAPHPPAARLSGAGTGRRQRGAGGRARGIQQHHAFCQSLSPGLRLRAFEVEGWGVVKRRYRTCVPTVKAC